MYRNHRWLICGVLLCALACSEEHRLLAQAERSYAEGDLPGALERYRAVLDRDPQNLRALHGSAVVHYSAERHVEALARLDELIALYPEATDDYLLRGHTLVRLERADDAIRDYETIRRLDPARSEALYALGMAHYNARRYETAAVWLERYLVQEPGASNAEQVRELIRYLEE